MTQVDFVADCRHLAEADAVIDPVRRPPPSAAQKSPPQPHRSRIHAGYPARPIGRAGRMIRAGPDIAPAAP